MVAAKTWLDGTSVEQHIRLGAYAFVYGDLLRDLPQDIFVPRSADRDFSWGFFKQVKGWLYSAVFKAAQHRRARLGALTRTRIFVSYSHKDATWLQTLQIHLKPLVADGLLDIWDDTRLRPGVLWRDEIDKALASARVAILLVSPDFLASDFIRTNELPTLLERASSCGTQILSVVVRPCLFKEHILLSQYQAANDPEHPLTGLPTHDAEVLLVRLARHIADLIPKNELGIRAKESGSTSRRPTQV